MATSTRARTTTGSSAARPLYASELASGLGDGVFWVGMVALIADEPDFEILLALAVLARLGPRALLSLPAGRLIDRTNVRNLLIQCELIRASIMLALAIALETGLAPVWALPFVALSYVAGVPTRPGVTASLPFVVPERELAHANAMVCTIRQVMTFVGPLVGVAVAFWSVPGTFAVNGISFALSALAFGLVRGRGWRRTAIHRRAVTGTRIAVASIDGIPTMIGLTVVMYFVRGAEVVLHVLIVRDVLGASPSSIGYLAGGVGVGAVVATPWARRAAARDTALPSIVFALAVTAAPTALLVATDRIATATLLVVPIGVGMVLFEVVSVITMQRTSPPNALGQVFGAVNTASNASKLAGAILIPPIAARLGVSTTTLLVAGVVALAVPIAWVPLARLSERADRRRAQVRPVADVLAGLAVFDGASRFAVERAAGYVVESRLEPGATPIVEGDRPDDLYVVRSGDFDVFVDDERVNHVGPGDWFGEIGLVHDLPRTATVRAVTEAVVWRIPGEVFLGVVTGLDDTAALDEGVARRLAIGRSSRSFDH